MRMRALRGGQLGQNLARRADVLVREHLDRRAAETAAIDDAGVVQLVGDHHIVAGQNRRYRPRVRGEAALKHDDGFGVLEFCQPALELEVDLQRAGNRSHRAGADAVPADRIEGSFAESGVRREAEIVVRRQVHHLPIVHDCLGSLGAGQDAEVTVQALGVEGLQLGREKAEWIGTHGSVRRPLPPDRASIRPAGRCSSRRHEDTKNARILMILGDLRGLVRPVRATDSPRAFH